MTDRVDPILLARKAAIESAMHADPTGPELRQAYLEALWALIRCDFGPAWVNLPELRAPLLLRGGTSDIGNLNQVFFTSFAGASGPFRYGDYGFDMAEPDTILDLGAYCGYAAAYFANRFPRARIIAVEPPGPNFEALRINTAPYPNITCLDAAVWHTSTMLRLGGYQLGDWGLFMTDAADGTPASSPADGLVPAYTIADLLATYGWDHVDYVKCVVEGAQVDILAAADRPWLDRVNTVSTRPPTGVWPHPDDEGRLHAAFPSETFSGTQIGELVVFRRRPERLTAAVAAVTPLPLLPPLPEARPYTLLNVGDDVGRFYRFDHGGLQLAPNEPGGRPAVISFPLVLAGHRRFTCQVAADAAGGRDIICRFALARPDGVQLASDACVARGGESVVWNLDFPPSTGLFRVSLSTEQTGPATDWHHTAVRFLDPRLL